MYAPTLDPLIGIEHQLNTRTITQQGKEPLQPHRLVNNDLSDEEKPVMMTAPVKAAALTPLKQTAVAKQIMGHKPVTLLNSASSQQLTLQKPVTLNTLKPSNVATQPERIRSKFFNRIGIDSSPAAAGTPENTLSNNTARPHPRAENINIFQETLKYDPHEEELITAQLEGMRRRQKMDNDEGDDEKKSKGRKISFSSNVSVLPVSFRTYEPARYNSYVRSYCSTQYASLHCVVNFAISGTCMFAAGTFVSRKFLPKQKWQRFIDIILLFSFVYL